MMARLPRRVATRRGDGVSRTGQAVGSGCWGLFRCSAACCLSATHALRRGQALRHTWLAPMHGATREEIARRRRDVEAMGEAPGGRVIHYLDRGHPVHRGWPTGGERFMAWPEPWPPGAGAQGHCPMWHRASPTRCAGGQRSAPRRVRTPCTVAPIYYVIRAKRGTTCTLYCSGFNATHCIYAMHARVAIACACSAS